MNGQGTARQPTANLVRRDMLKQIAAFGLSAAGLVSVAGCGSAAPPLGPALGLASPEVTRVRLPQSGSLCQAPLLLTEELLHAEGITEVEFVKVGVGISGSTAIANGQADVGLAFSGPGLLHIDAGDPVVFLGGYHVGCFEVFGTSQIKAIRDLKGKTLAVRALNSPEHVYLATMLAYVGVNPNTDINWVLHTPDESMALLAEERIDAFLTLPPFGLEVRARKIGHVILNSTLDRPWSQYYCCMMIGRREFVQQYPATTFRTMRALMKATDLCTADPDRAAQQLVDRGFTPRQDYAAQTLKDLPFDRWREYDPEDTLRFYALRLHEVGMIRIPPDRALSQATDWRFFNELRQELKG